MDNPIKTYNENGNVEHECYYKNGNIHKIDGPSYIGYHANGDVRSEFWTYDNKSHRLCGPDHITYYDNGNVENERWYVNGTKILNPPNNWPLTKNEQIEMNLQHG